MIKMYEHGPVTVLQTGRNVICNLVNYYAYCYTLGDTLIDSSTLHIEQELVDCLRDRGIKRIINTHCHEDHIGNNLALERQLHTEVYAAPASIPLMEAPTPAKQHFYLRLMWGYPPPCTARPLPVEFSFDGYTLISLPTPGHSSDHICLYEPELKTLFTGDVFCGTRVKYLRADEDFKQQLESIRKLADLDVETIYCSVAGAVEGAGAAIKSKLQYMEDLEGRVLDMYKSGASPTEIRIRILGKEGLMYWVSAGHFAKQHLINSILQVEERSKTECH